MLARQQSGGHHHCHLLAAMAATKAARIATWSCRSRAHRTRRTPAGPSAGLRQIGQASPMARSWSSFPDREAGGEFVIEAAGRLDRG